MMMFICFFMPPVISVFLLEKVVFKQVYDWAKRIYSYIFSFLFANTISLLFFSLQHSYSGFYWKSIRFDRTFNKTEACVKYLLLSMVLSFLAPFICKIIVKHIKAVKQNDK